MHLTCHINAGFNYIYYTMSVKLSVKSISSRSYSLFRLPTFESVVKWLMFSDPLILIIDSVCAEFIVVKPSCVGNDSTSSSSFLAYCSFQYWFNSCRHILFLLKHYYNTPMYMQYTAIFDGCKNDNFQSKNCDVFHISA